MACIALIEAKDARARSAEAKTETEFKNELSICRQSIEVAMSMSADADRLSALLAAYPEARFQVLLTRSKVLEVSAILDKEAAKSLRRDAATSREAEALESSAQDKVQQAIRKLNDALDAIELPRAMTVGAEDERAIYFSQFAPAFDLLVEIYVEQGRAREAIETAERRRSRTFLDQLRAGGVDVYATLPAKDDILVRQEKQLSDDYYTLLARIRENPDDELIRKLQQVKAEWIESRNRLLSASPAYRKLLANPIVDGTAPTEQANVDERQWVAKQIGPDDLALIYYLGKNKSYVFACSERSGIKAYPLVVSPQQVANLGMSRGSSVARLVRTEDAKWMVNRVIGGIDVALLSTGRGSSSQPWRSVEFRASDIAIIAEILVPQELRELIREQNPPHLVIVPDGALHQLPFEPLTTDSAGREYLIQQLPPLAYAPSLAIYRLLREAPVDPSHFSLLSVANPKYAAGLETGKPTIDVSTTGEEFAAACGFTSLPPLPATERESLDVCRAFADAFGDSASVRSLSGDQASEANVRECLREGRFTFLHFAVHGLVDQQYQNLFGALALATPERPTQTDDGFLTLQEILAHTVRQHLRTGDSDRLPDELRSATTAGGGLDDRSCVHLCRSASRDLQSLERPRP